MKEQLINHPKLNVQLRTGQEGPRYDPYHYEEFTVKTDKDTVMMHVGLSNFAVINDVRVDYGPNEKVGGKHWSDGVLATYTGFSFAQIYKFYHRKNNYCKVTGKWHEPETMQGFPGESFEVCIHCGKIVGSYFCESAVM